MDSREPKPDPQLSARDLAVLVREMRRAEDMAAYKISITAIKEHGRLRKAVDKACNQILGEPQPVKGT